MITLAPKSEAEMLAAHGASRRSAARASSSASSGSQRRPPANLRVITSLGDMEFITFRGRAYGVPPVPLQAGHVLLETYLSASDGARALAEAAERGETDKLSLEAYFAALKKLPRLLWRLTRDTSRSLRILRLLGLRRNPFLSANEAEIMDLAHFFYSRRMRSGGGFRILTPADHSRGPIY